MSHDREPFTPDPPKAKEQMFIILTRRKSGTFHASVDDDGRGTGTEAMGLTESAAIAQALHQLSDAVGMPAGICLYCEGPLKDRTGAYVHAECVDVDDEEESDEDEGLEMRKPTADLTSTKKQAAFDKLLCLYNHLGQNLDERHETEEEIDELREELGLPEKLVMKIPEIEAEAKMLGVAMTQNYRLS